MGIKLHFSFFFYCILCTVVREKPDPGLPGGKPLQPTSETPQITNLIHTLKHTLKYALFFLQSSQF